MADPIPPVFYDDPEVQAAHQELFTRSTQHPIPTVFPPGASQTDFLKALAEWQKALGWENVHTGEALRNYVDPFELWEDTTDRRVPSAAIW